LRTASGPTTRSVTVYTAWPFSAKEAAKRQADTAGALVVPVDMSLDLGDKSALKLVLIPAGQFVMGSPEQEQADAKAKAEEHNLKEDFSNEGPAHTVVITRPFYMGVYPVTQAQYERVTGRNPSRFKGPLLPVDGVSWKDAAEFCVMLSRRTGRLVRLPTEAEMEYAARSGAETAFCTGSDLGPEQAIWDNKQTVPVEDFAPNAFGLHDMNGNIRQWCADWYDEGYYDVSPTVDPQGPFKGYYHVVRGNAWNGWHWQSRSAARFRVGRDGKRDVGLRIVVEAPGSIAPSRPGEAAVAELIRLLGDDKFQVRDDATYKLARMGADIRLQLEDALRRKDLEIEVRERILIVMKEIAPPAKVDEVGAVAFTERALASPISEAQIRWYTKAIELNPNYGLALFNRGSAYSDLNHFDESLADSTAAIERDPEYCDIYIAHSNRSSDLCQKGRIKEAAIEADKAIELKPDFALAHFNRGNASYVLKEYDEAIKHYSKAIELDPKLYKAYWSRAMAYVGKKQFDRAIEECDKVIEIKSDEAEVYVWRAAAYREKHQLDRAVKDCAKALELDPDSTDAYIGLALAHDAAGKSDQAVRECALAIEINPDRADSYEARARAYCHLKEYDKAWADVKLCRKQGGAPDAGLVEELSKASGRREQPSSAASGAAQ